MEIEKKMERKEKKQRNHDQRNPSFSWWTTTTTTTNSHGVNRTKPRIRIKDWREETKKKRKILGKNGTSLPPWKRGEDELRFSNPKRKRKKQRENTRNETRLTNITRDRRYATATIHHQPSKRTNQPIDSKIIYVGYTDHGGGGGGRRGEREETAAAAATNSIHTPCFLARRRPETSAAHVRRARNATFFLHPSIDPRRRRRFAVRSAWPPSSPLLCTWPRSHARVPDPTGFLSPGVWAVWVGVGVGLDRPGFRVHVNVIAVDGWMDGWRRGVAARAFGWAQTRNKDDDFSLGYEFSLFI